MSVLTAGRPARRERGASLVETAIVAPLLLLMGLGTVQAGLVYHAKTIVNYATFEAARTGATRNAQPGPMRRELGSRLAPLLGGDGSTERAAMAIARSIVEVDSPVNLDGSMGPPTRLEILNPTEASFADWGQPSLETRERTAIPNSHLRHQGEEVKAASGQTLQDANLLKVAVTHGYELKVPLVGRLYGQLMSRLDVENAAYYLTGRIPLTSVATVRMQSEAWSDSLALANVPPPVAGTPDGLVDPSAAAPPGEGDDTDADGEGEGEGDCGDDGLGSTPILVSSGDGQCAVDEPLRPSDPLADALGGSDAGDDVESSPIC